MEITSASSNRQSVDGSYASGDGCRRLAKLVKLHLSRRGWLPALGGEYLNAFRERRGDLARKKAGCPVGDQSLRNFTAKRGRRDVPSGVVIAFTRPDVRT